MQIACSKNTDATHREPICQASTPSNRQLLPPFPSSSSKAFLSPSSRAPCLADHWTSSPTLQVHWQYSSEAASRRSNKNEAYHIITMGNDGRILIWQWTKLDNPIYGS